MKTRSRIGLKRGLWPAVLGSLVLHGAFAALWVWWSEGRDPARAIGQAVPAVIEIIVATLPAPAPLPITKSADFAPANPAPASPVQVDTTPAPALPVATRVDAEPRMVPRLEGPPSARRVHKAVVRPRAPSTALADIEPAAGAVPPAETEDQPSALPMSGGEGAAIASIDDTAASGRAVAAGTRMPPLYVLGSASNPLPAYPLAARYDGVEGQVLLRVQVDAAGRVQGVTVAATSGHAILDRAAAETVSRWQFEPAREGGNTVPGEIDVPIRFRLRG